MQQQDRYNANNRLVNYVIKERGGEENVKYHELPTNYGELSPVVKIHILDTIIKQAQSVFGPYGGIYGELKSAEMMGGQQVTEGGYEKSKDGHSFFNSIELGSKYAQTIMKSIQQMTKYVAGYEGDTSRDGTTSLAIVGCNAAKYLLINRLGKEPIPSTIQNAIFDIALFHGTNLIENHKVPIYDKATNKYLENGYETAVRAISTTVDMNRLFVDPFSKMMKEASEKGYDLLNCHLATPNNVDGLAGLELKINAGIRFRATNLDKNTAGGFYGHNSYTFVLDGYISPEHRDIYVYHLKKWLKHICSLRDEQGLLFAPGRFDVPLLIVTRTPDYLESVYKGIMEDGIEVVSNGTKHVIKPKIMLGNNTESCKVYFDDMLEVFAETRIDLNRINRYIRDNKTTSDDINAATAMADHVKVGEVSIASFFPTITAVPNSAPVFTICVPEPNDVYDEGIPDEVEQTAKYVNISKYKFSPANVMLISNYDGQSLSLVPPNDELAARSNAKRDELLKMKESLSDLALEDNSIPERLAFFSSMTIKPIISARSKDEYYQMFSIYEDALGVFQSIHKHGVMPGGNMFMLKFRDELHKRVMDQLDEIFVNNQNINPDRVKPYKEFAEDVVNAIELAYIRTYELLVGEKYAGEVLEYINANKESVKENILLTYDVVTGNWGTGIVEAARTTADVFASSISMMKDMLQLKRIKLYTQNAEHTQVHIANKELALDVYYQDTNKK